MMANYTIHTGDNQQILDLYPNDHFDAIITDPPYGIEFLGKDWDANTGAINTWRQCLRVLKPGGYLLAFSAARTYHHLASNIESVGFEIRDQLMWLYASGFPKAQDIGKAIDKRGGMVSNNEDTKSLKNILIELFKASGKSNSQINKECGFNASGYLRQHDNGVDGWGYALPLNDKWQTLKKVLECSDAYDKYFISSERAVVGTKEAGCFDQNFKSHTIGARGKTIDITAPATEQANHWHGWKTSLKPAHEPIVMARKPFKGSTIDNVLKHGVGALNIDESRIPYDGEKDLDTYLNNIAGPMERSTASHGDTIGMHESKTGFKVQKGKVKRPIKKGKDPRNRLRELDGTTTKNMAGETEEWTHNEQGRFPSNVMGEIEGYQKYFYCPKVSRRERHCGYEQLPNAYDRRTEGLQSAGIQGIQKLNGEKTNHTGNNHPTVKPVALMRYLIQLVVPKNSMILDPFTGSGSTGMAAVELGHTFVGCELDPHYVDIARRRIEGWLKPQDHSTYEALFEDE